MLRSYREPAEQELLEAPGLQDVTLMTLDSVADHMELGGSRELSLGDAMQFHDPLNAATLGALHRAAGDPADSRLYVDALIHALAAHLLQHYSRGRHAEAGLPPQPERLMPRRIRRVTDYIRANLAADLAIGELAALAGLSSFHFARVFRRETVKRLISSSRACCLRKPRGRCGPPISPCCKSPLKLGSRMPVISPCSSSGTTA